MRRSRGFTLMESLVTLVVTGMIVGVLGRVVVSTRRALEVSTGTAEEVEAARIGRTLVDRVIGAGGVLPEAAGPGEVRVRLPIGWAEPCDSVFVWHGIRAPDPDRDSAVVVDAHSRRYRVRVVDASTEICSASVEGARGARRMLFDPVVPTARLVRVYESGSVRVDDAVRYARSGTPRQPLTVPVLLRSTSSVDLAPGILRMRLESTEGRVWSREWTIR